MQQSVRCIMGGSGRSIERPVSARVEVIASPWGCTASLPVTCDDDWFSTAPAVLPVRYRAELAVGEGSGAQLLQVASWSGKRRAVRPCRAVSVWLPVGQCGFAT